MLLRQTFTIIFVVTAVAASDPRLAQLDQDTRDLLNMLHDSCIEETGLDESLGWIDKARTGEFTEDQTFKNYLGCIYMQTGALAEDGEADYDAMLAVLPEQFLERATKMVNQCRHVRENNAPDTAFVLNKCLYKADPEYYFIF
ncbi:hypothetical protein C0J52_03448 [Blattella germanica]|uniref:Chemosensory protein n=1 Tax=Blattella germanica TaxID=6973 RepID=A0A0X8DC69_BLAGE|nr:chemosensory protein [Blattella germanica]PSN48081.1 hypothetical protein C0J52_03448 [Blattella germanica]